MNMPLFFVTIIGSLVMDITIRKECTQLFEHFFMVLDNISIGNVAQIHVFRREDSLNFHAEESGGWIGKKELVGCFAMIM